MVVTVVVLVAVVVALAAVFAALVVYSRTPAWSRSELRMSTMRFLVIIGPFFGVHVEPPKPEPPAVTATGPDGDDTDRRPRIVR